MKNLTDFLFSTLRGRIIISMTTIIAVTMTLFILYLTSRQREMLLEQQTKESIVLSQSLSTTASGWIFANDVAGLQELVEAQNQYPELIFAILTDDQGLILADTDKSKIGKFLLDFPKEPQQKIMSKTLDLVDVVVPAKLAGRHVGWVRIGLGKKLAAANLNKIVQNGVLYGILAILIGSIIAWFMGNQMTKRLYEIQHVINEVGRGNPSARSTLTGNDEAAMLAKEFNEMLDALSESDVKLTQSDIRFEKIFNLSTYPLALIDKENKIISLNNQFEKVLGYNIQDIPTINEWWQFAYTDPEYRKSIIEAWKTALNNAIENNTNIESSEQKLNCKNGELRTFVISGTQIDTDLLVTFFDITERIKTDEKITQLSQAVEQSPVTIVITDLSGDIQYMNHKFFETTGYTYEEVIGKNTRILKTDYTSAEDYKKLWETIIAGNEWHGIFHNKKKDGSLFWESVSISPIKNSHGKNTSYIAIKEDITEIIKIEEEIKKNQIYTRSLIEASLDSLVTINIEGEITDVNEAMVTTTGVPREELINSHLSDYFTEPDKVREIIDSVFEKGSGRDFQLTMKNRNESLTDVLLNAAVYKDEKDIPVGVFAAARDITIQKQVLQYSRRLIEASIDPLITINPEGKITDANFATVKVFGAARGEIIGTDFSSYFTDQEKAKESYLQVFEKGSITNYPLTVKDKKGKLIEVSFNASIYRDDKGKVVGVFADARDITSQKQASQYARSLIEASLDPLVTINAEGKITDVNQAFVKITGVPREVIIGTAFLDYFTEPEKAQESYRLVFEKGELTDYPLTIKNKNGNLTDVLYNASVYKDYNGNVIGVFAAARDMTAQKEIDRKEKEVLGVDELEKFRKLFVGRELKMIDLEKEVEELKNKLSEIQNK
jgi:PAS domain S-box-containing protein